MSDHDEDLPPVTQELISEVMPLLRDAVGHKLAAQQADEALQELLGCYDGDLSVLTAGLANSLKTADELNDDNVVLFIDQVSYLAQSGGEEDDEDGDDEEDEEEVLCDHCGRPQSEHDEGNINHRCSSEAIPCALCGDGFFPGDDAWDDLDPECADRVSCYMDMHKIADEDRDKAVKALRTLDGLE